MAVVTQVPVGAGVGRRDGPAEKLLRAVVPARSRGRGQTEDAGHCRHSETVETWACEELGILAHFTLSRQRFGTPSSIGDGFTCTND